MIPIAFAGCLGWLHPAAGGRGVVLCPPWGFEELCVHRSLLLLADRLAEAGMPCLRFDLPGTGDSLDPPPGAPLLASWVEAIRAAVGCLRDRAGVREVALVGLRLGALLAAEAAHRLGGVEALALLAPPRSGRSYVRELRAWARFAEAAPGDHGSAIGPDGLVAGGFALDTATLAELAGLDPLGSTRAPSPRVLLLDRPDGSSGGEALRAWAASDASVEIAPFEGHAELMRDPLLSEPPRAAFDRLVAFLAAGSPRGAGSVRHAAGSPPEAVLEGPGFVERTLRLGPGRRLVGTLAEPAPVAATARRPALLLLNTGATRRAGPGRAAVELARALACEGVRSLRLDLGGLGDSGAPPGERAGDIYRKGALEEVRAAVDLLVARGAETVVALGVCSGAFMAFHAALGDPRLAGLVLVNLPRFAWRPFHPLVFVRTRVLLGLVARPATWWRGLAGHGELLPALRVLGERAGGRLAIRLPGPIRRAVAAIARPARGLRALARRGVRLLVVYAADDPGLPIFERLLEGGRGPPVDGALELRVIEGAGHTFAAPAARSLLLRLVRNHLDRHWPPCPAARPITRPGERAIPALAATGPPEPPTERPAPASAPLEGACALR